MVGLNMLAQVGWDPIEFIRQLFWLSLDPPAPKYGLSSRLWLRVAGTCFPVRSWLSP